MASNENDEIEKIMSEIEELQKEMAPAGSAGAQTAPAQASAPVPSQADTQADTTIGGVEEDILREIQASAHAEAEGGLEETLTELKQEEAAGGVLAAATQTEDPHEETRDKDTMSQTNTNGDGTLSLTLTGNMTLKLKYEFEGQEVTISFVDQALRVQMTDGTEFKVPVTRGQSTTQARNSNVKPFKKAV